MRVRYVLPLLVAAALQCGAGWRSSLPQPVYDEHRAVVHRAGDLMKLDTVTVRIEVCSSFDTRLLGCGSCCGSLISHYGYEVRVGDLIELDSLVAL